MNGRKSKIASSLLEKGGKEYSADGMNTVQFIPSFVRVEISCQCHLKRKITYAGSQQQDLGEQDEKGNDCFLAGLRKSVPNEGHGHLSSPMFDISKRAIRYLKKTISLV